MATTKSEDHVDGPAAIEFILGTQCFSEMLYKYSESLPMSIQVHNVKSKKEQQILGMSKIIMILYPFATELALKALWRVMHSSGDHPGGHSLKDLFGKLSENATDESDAKEAQDQARKYWSRRKTQHTPGTLDEILDLVSEDFTRIRYGHYKELDGRNTPSYTLLLGAIVDQLAKRDPDTRKSLTIE